MPKRSGGGYSEPSNCLLAFFEINDFMGWKLNSLYAMTRSSRKIHSSSSIKCDGASVYNHSVKSPPPTALSSETSIACDSLINIVDLSRCASQIRNQAKDTKLNTVDMLHGDEIKTNNFVNM
ncbi:unnamed protein product [Heterobilharzia americana]|nr:unnamed protein product [Heterobilharzia americana]